MQPIAHIQSPYKEKFGTPRQAGLVGNRATVVFEPKYRVAEAVRGLEEFDYVWLLWQFHLAERAEWSPTVRPPRLGGNRRMGVFATRSPFRPNPIGLSAVRLLSIEQSQTLGPLLHVEGSDLVDGTPILDIKPYLPYADAHPEARSGFANEAPSPTLTLADPHNLLATLPPADRHALATTLCLDPRPHYHTDPSRLYGLAYGPYQVHFRVEENQIIVESITC